MAVKTNALPAATTLDSTDYLLVTTSGGTQRIRKDQFDKLYASLVDGQMPYAQAPHLIKNTVLYVDAALGKDANPGTQDKPFKTIQAAVDSLPRDLGGHSIII